MEVNRRAIGWVRTKVGPLWAAIGSNAALARFWILLEFSEKGVYTSFTQYDSMMDDSSDLLKHYTGHHLTIVLDELRSNPYNRCGFPHEAFSADRALIRSDC